MRNLLILAGLLLFSIRATAQVSDSTQIRKKSFESSFFLSADTLTENDYLLRISGILQILNKVSVVTPPEIALDNIEQKLNGQDSVLSIIKSRLEGNERILKIRNLQMYDILLHQMQRSISNYASTLNGYDSSLVDFKHQVTEVVKDTILRTVFRSPALRDSFKIQLADLRTKWRAADSIVRYSNGLVQDALAHSSNNLIAINELQIQNENLIGNNIKRIFGKERRYLWQPVPARVNQFFSHSVKRNLSSEQKITQYYFNHTHYQIRLLLLIGLLVFFWIVYNYHSIRKRHQLATLKQFNFRYINGLPFFAAVMTLLNLAPLFDLNAPPVYTEFIGFLTMIVLTIYFVHKLPARIQLLWGLFVLSFLLTLTGYLRLPSNWDRWVSLFINIGSIALASYTLRKYRPFWRQYKLLTAMTGFYLLANFIAALCNLFGRVTLTQILTSASIFALVQAVSLMLFIRIATEMIVLQIHRSRIMKGYSETFDYSRIITGIRKMVTVGAAVIWLIVFATNLNLYNSLSEAIGTALTTPRTIGSFSFTLGGVILFLFIIWVANFLQKYIGYFFGDIGEEVSTGNKAYRSRLLITRLILLIGGFLLAVAASGLPVDRVTVILGALGVGVGLGLQSIVNNFVSGIILIFDRTLRIGDTVKIGSNEGRVKEISVRASTLLTADGAEIIIPNGDILSHDIINWTLSNNFTRINIGLKINEIVATTVLKDWVREIVSDIDGVVVQKAPEVLISNLTSQSMEIKISTWCNDVAQTDEVKSKIYLALYKKFSKQNIRVI